MDHGINEVTKRNIIANITISIHVNHETPGLHNEVENT